jgi:AcrR family transcriptional regulator
MAESVKRRYRSDHRAAQARETRRTIVDAAAALFTRDGYGPTTVDVVAARAEVSRKTVFLAVGGKADLLNAAINRAIAGDDEPVPLAERAEIVRMLESQDPMVILTEWCAVLVGIDRRVAALFRALEVAADADDSARALLATFSRQRLVGARAVVRRLDELGALHEGLGADDAADVAWLAGDPTLYDRLVRQRRWSVTRFEAWLYDSLVSQLIGAQHSAGR